jgi:multiple sugar transport system permease protein
MSRAPTAPAPVVRRPRPRGAPAHRQQRRTAWLMVAPVVLGLICFTAYPFFASLYFSFCDYDLFSPPRFIGLWNYQTMCTRDPLFWTSLGNVLVFTAASVPLGILAGVFLALLLDAKIKGLAIYRTVFFLPSIVPAVASSVLWMWLLNADPKTGLVNTALSMAGVPDRLLPGWLGSDVWCKPSLVLMSLWGVGGSMIIYLAGLKDIPLSLYEAAVVDGASLFQRVRYVTVPMLTPVIFFNLVMGLIGSFQYFTQAYVVFNGGGGPMDAGLFYALHLFYQAFSYLKMGYASAMAWVLFVLVLGLTAILFKTQGRWVHYGR